MPTAYELDNVADRHLTMDEALDLDQQKLDVLMSADTQYDLAFAGLKQTVLDLKAERDRYEAALRKIAGWRGYQPRVSFSNGEGETVVVNSRYEEGANDMLATLKQMAEEALA